MQKSIKIDSIKPNPHQPRTKFDPEGIREISASIKRLGILQPLLVRALNDGTYELIAGQRRLEGSKMAGLSEVPVIVKDATDSEMLEMAIVENLHREDMSPIDKAEGFRKLMVNFNLTQNQIANLLGISRPSVANTIRLLDLPKNIISALHNKDITEGHARALLYIKDEGKREVALNRILNSKLSVRDAEELSRVISKQNKSVNSEDRNLLSAEEKDFVERLGERLGTKIQIVRDGVTGRIVIEFYSHEHLQFIAESI